MALTDRVQAILLRPRETWPVIDAEPTTTSELYQSYIMPLAAIGPVAQVVGTVIFGTAAGVVGAGLSLGLVIVTSIFAYVLTLASLYVIAIIIDQLAPSFGGQRDMQKALKVAAYSSTPQWIVAIVALVPVIGILSILGLYSFYLVYLGLPVLMRSPQDRAITYTIACVLVAIVVTVAVGVVIGIVVALLAALAFFV